MNQEHLSAGEWDRWQTNDREWKREALDHLINHGERLARLETYRDDVGRAESAATSTKKWAVVGGVVAAIINGALIAMGIKQG